MSTRGAMRTRIASELRRPAGSSGTWYDHITNAINSAIGTLQKERFAFTETRAITFSTVANQARYGASDNAALGRLRKIDSVLIYLSANQPFTLMPMSAADLERFNMNDTQTGQPYKYCWYGEQIGLHYVPAAVYTVRILGITALAAPADDNEASNKWMTDAEEAVRCLAKYLLYEHVLMDDKQAAKFNPVNEAGPTHRAIAELKRMTNRLTRSGNGETLVEATAF